MNQIQYGNTKKTKIIDGNGSTKETDTTYRAGVAIVTERFNIRERLTSRDIDEATLAHKLKELFDDASKINPGIELETKSNGQTTNHYLVISYTKLNVE